MSGEEKDRVFAERMRKLLDESAVRPDEQTRMRLRSIRLKALEVAEQGMPWYLRFPRWVTAGGLATAMVLVIAVSLWMGTGRNALPVTQVEDLDILTNNEQLELYKDLDFYRWLESADNSG
ncbi:MAG TPA: hypothetical protein PK036_00710 [Geobacteraceae bacterium]|nr:hypothetical protein [Geobacteraceae bacterium]